MTTDDHYPAPHPHGNFRRACAHCHVEWPCPTATLAEQRRADQAGSHHEHRGALTRPKGMGETPPAPLA